LLPTDHSLVQIILEGEADHPTLCSPGPDYTHARIAFRRRHHLLQAGRVHPVVGMHYLAVPAFLRDLPKSVIPVLEERQRVGVVVYADALITIRVTLGDIQRVIGAEVID